MLDWRYGILVLFTAACTAAPSVEDVPDAAGADAGETQDDAGPQIVIGDRLYDESRVVELRLDFPGTEWEQLLELREAGSKDYVHCSVTFEEVSFKDAGCRSKGNPEVWPDELKPELVVSFTAWTKGGRFGELRRLNLEANPYSPAPIRDRLGMHLMRAAGVVAPRANHARVFRGDELLGLYQNIEVIDATFLERRFEHPEGNLWKAGYDLKTNEKLNDETRIWELGDLVDDEPLDGDHTAFYKRLGAMVDVPQVLLEMAAETSLPTADNFSNGSWNYFLYDDPGTGRFVVLPWDLDTIINKYAPADADVWAFTGHEIGNPPNRMRELINTNPVWREQFVTALADIRDGPLSDLPDVAAGICAQIRDDVIMDVNRPSTVAAFDADCTDIQSRLRERIDFLRTALSE